MITIRKASIALAAAFGLFGTAAHASTTSFSGTITTGGAFTDFVVLDRLVIGGSGPFLVTGGVSSNSYSITVPTPIPGFGIINVVISGAALNINALSLIGTSTTYTDTNLADGFNFASIAPDTYKLAISGINPNANGIGGLYAGEVTVSAVPEAQTLALAAAGLAVVGGVAARRRRPA